MKPCLRQLSPNPTHDMHKTNNHHCYNRAHQVELRMRTKIAQSRRIRMIILDTKNLAISVHFSLLKLQHHERAPPPHLATHTAVHRTTHNERTRRRAHLGRQRQVRDHMYLLHPPSFSHFPLTTQSMLTPQRSPASSAKAYPKAAPSPSPSGKKPTTTATPSAYTSSCGTTADATMPLCRRRAMWIV